MNNTVFSLHEISWLKDNPSIHECINESLEDSLNVNSLDSGEPDLIPFERTVTAAHITIEIAQKKMIAGPYNNNHFKSIGSHLKNFDRLASKEKVFWKMFSFYCACTKEENERLSNERIYMQGMVEMIREIEEGSFDLFESDDNRVANLNEGTIQQIKGKGVNARFVD